MNTKDHSAYPKEEEILLNDGIAMKVVDVQENYEIPAGEGFNDEGEMVVLIVLKRGWKNVKPMYILYINFMYIFMYIFYI